MSTATITVRSFLEAAGPALVAVVGVDGFRALGKRSQELTGDGGTTREWIMAMGVAVAELDNPAAELALLRVMDSL